MNEAEAVSARKNIRRIRRKKDGHPLLHGFVIIAGLAFFLYCAASIVLTQAEIAEKRQELDVLAEKALHPDALVLVHPECIPAVTAHADYVGSTSGIVNFAVKSDAKEFIIGTEISIAEHLQYACPDKEFYPLSKHLICPNMKRTTLMDVYKALSGGGLEIEMSPEVMKKARVCIDRMLELG